MFNDTFSNISVIFVAVSFIGGRNRGVYLIYNIFVIFCGRVFQ